MFLERYTFAAPQSWSEFLALTQIIIHFDHLLLWKPLPLSQIFRTLARNIYKRTCIDKVKGYIRIFITFECSMLEAMEVWETEGNFMDGMKFIQVFE